MKSVKDQILEWVEKNERALNNLERGQVVIEIHQFKVRSMSVTQTACSLGETMAAVKLVEPTEGERS